MHHIVEVDLGGRKITLETGKMAKQAGGAVVVRSGDAVVLVTACMADQPKVGAGFFPLTVDYREYTYAAGKIPGGFIKREGRPSEKEVLTSRLIDRPIRPLFPEGFLHETQIIAMVLSADPEQDPNSLAIAGTAAALAISEIPFPYVLGGVRVSMKDGKYIANSTYTEGRESKLNIVVAGTEEGIVMVEAGAQEVSEAEVLGAIEFGHECCKKIAAGIRELMKLAGKTKREFVPHVLDQAIYDAVEKTARVELTDAMDTAKHEKIASYALIAALKKRIVEGLPEEQREEGGKSASRLSKSGFSAMKCSRIAAVRMAGRSTRSGRSPSKPACSRALTVRPCLRAAKRKRWSQSRSAPRTMSSGSNSWSRVKRPSVSCCTTTSPRSVWEKPEFMRGPGRREIGHGALAERSLTALIPGEDKIPYTMRVVSDILESNGSSSQATVCGASLALMDAGAPMTAHVGGIAMGLECWKAR